MPPRSQRSERASGAQPRFTQCIAALFRRRRRRRFLPLPAVAVRLPSDPCPCSCASAALQLRFSCASAALQLRSAQHSGMLSPLLLLLLLSFRVVYLLAAFTQMLPV